MSWQNFHKKTTPFGEWITLNKINRHYRFALWSNIITILQYQTFANKSLLLILIDSCNVITCVI